MIHALTIGGGVFLRVSNANERFRSFLLGALFVGVDPPVHTGFQIGEGGSLKLGWGASASGLLND